MWVLAYGSLLAQAGRDGIPVILLDHRRRWDVAMENTRDLPGYRFFRDSVTGERPDVAVAFVNAVRRPGAYLNAVAFPATPPEIEALDARERNYERVEISGLVRPRLDAEVWAYRGLPASRDRFDQARSEGRAVVSRAYHDAVRAGFAALGPDALLQFDRTTDPPAVPLRDLVAVPLP